MDNMDRRLHLVDRFQSWTDLHASRHSHAFGCVHEVEGVAIVALIELLGLKTIVLLCIVAATTTSPLPATSTPRGSDLVGNRNVCRNERVCNCTNLVGKSPGYVEVVIFDRQAS